jgi:hypothetical protein
MLYKSLKAMMRSTLVAVVLQNRRELDLLTTEKRQFMPFPGEDCCFFTVKSGIIRNRIKNLKERAQQLTFSKHTNILSSLYQWLILLVVPLVPVCLTLMFLPCLINIFQKFLQKHFCHLPSYLRGTT